MPLDLASLRRLAEQATPGPWRSDCILPPEHATRLHTVRSDDDPPTRIIAENCYERDGVFIAACSPTTILALLNVIERQRAALTIIHYSLPTESVLRSMAQRALSEDETP